MAAYPTRIIHAGLGEWGLDWRAKVFPSVPSTSVVASVEPSVAIRARLAGSSADDTPCYASLEEALSKTECDAVLITSNHASHIPLAVQALSAGKHVLVEKPFAATVREAQEAVALAGRHDLTLMVSQNYRRFPAPEAVAALVRRGDLGSLQSISVRFDVRMTYDDPNAGHYSHTEPLLEAVSIHHLDLMRFVSGADPVSVTCKKWSPPGSPFHHPPAASLIARLPDGGVIDYEGNVFSSEEKTPLSGRWTMRFAEGICYWTSTGERDPTLADEKVVIRYLDGRTEELPLTRPALYGRAALLSDFARAVGGITPPESCSLGKDNLMTLAMIEGAIDSSRTEREVEIAEILRRR